MDFKKYLVFLFVFVLGIVIGKNMPAIDSQSNTAATTTGSRTIVAPTTDPYTVTPTPVTTTNQQSDVYTYPTDEYYPPVNTNVPSPSTTTQPIILPSPYVGINTLTSNMSRGNIYNDRTQVADLQKFLITGGFLTGIADGSFGKMTQRAVINFQTAHQISPALGYVGPKTRNYINQIVGANYGSQPSVEKVCVCEKIGSGEGPLSFSGNYNGSTPVGGNFTSSMGGTNYHCTVVSG